MVKPLIGRNICAVTVIWLESASEQKVTNTNTRTAARWCDEVEHDAKFSGSAPVKKKRCNAAISWPTLCNCNQVKAASGSWALASVSFNLVEMAIKKRSETWKLGLYKTKVSRNHELTTLTIFLLIFNKHSLHTHTAFRHWTINQIAEKEAYLKDEDATFEVQNVDVLVLFRCFCLFVCYCFLAEAN